MNLDQALQDLEAAAARRAGTPPTEQIVAARRRRRRVRRTTAAAVSGVATAAVVVGGAWALTRPDVPTPPVVTVAPSPSPTPTPTPSEPAAPAVALPTGDPSLPFGACGSLASSPTAHPVSEVISAHVTVADAEVSLGSPVDVSTGFFDLGTGGRDLETGVLPAQGPTLLWLRDGVVVGVDDAFAGTLSGWEEWHPAVFVGGSLVQSATVPTVCSPGAALADQPRAVALPPGDYELVATGTIAALGPESEDAPVWELDDAQLQAAAEAAGFLTAVSEPARVTIEGPADAGPFAVAPRAPGGPALADVGSQLVPDPACGQPAPVPGAAEPGGLSVDVPPPASMTVAAGAPLPAGATVTYDGPGVLELSMFDGPQLYLVRDGVVVGTTQRYTDVGYLAATLSSGARLPLALDPVPTSCEGSPTGEDLPAEPGVYDAYLGVVVVSGRVWVDGAWQPLERYGAAFGPRFTLTVTG